MDKVDEMKKRGLVELDYLGDGVYVGHNNFCVVLFLLDTGFFGPDAIALETEALVALDRYVKRVTTKEEEKRDDR